MATISITTPANQDQRIAAAFGKRLGLEGNATGAQIKQQIIQFLINAVQEQEQGFSSISGTPIGAIISGGVITVFSGISQAGMSGIAHRYIAPPSTTALCGISRSDPDSISSTTYLVDGVPI